MEAKDTIIDLKDIANESLRIQMTKILEQQAEISFWAGVREVMEWLKIWRRQPPKNWYVTGDGDESHIILDGIKHRILIIPESKWQEFKE